MKNWLNNFKLPINIPDINKLFIVIYSIVIIIVSFFSYFFNYQNPPAPFWDENYHIASAQKYIQGNFFMEPHPPLGKMFIALGEVIFNPNQNVDTSDFINTDYIDGKDIPKEYSFLGVRFFSALFGWLSAILFFIILLQLLKNPHLALLFSSFYIFDNAMIVHFRGAMLDSFLIFFVLASVSWFIQAFQKKSAKVIDYLVLGLLIGLTTSVKLNGLIVILLPVFLAIKEFLPLITSWLNKTQKISNLYQNILKIIFRLSLSVATFSLVFSSIFIGHFMLTPKTDERTQTYLQNLNTESDKQKLLELIESGLNFDMNLAQNLVFITQQNLIYSNNYNKGVPKLDITKADENGSSPFTWPFGNRTISYRWASNDGITSYLYIVPNPIIWLLAFIGVLLTSIWIISVYLFKAKIKNTFNFQMAVVFAFIYWAYLFSASQIQRVMYLYHYFIPLVIAMLCFIVIFNELTSELKPLKSLNIAGFITFLIYLAFIVYSPFTYYVPINRQDFDIRNRFEFWQMRSAP